MSITVTVHMMNGVMIRCDTFIRIWHTFSIYKSHQPFHKQTKEFTCQL